jgi:serine phosphatase RsbU (regulator of sigma subunit)
MQFGITGLFAADNIFWDNERILETGNINKFSTFNNADYCGIVFSSNDESRKLFLKYSKDGINWKNTLTVLSDFYTQDSSGVDFSTIIDNDDKLYIFYRTGLNNIILERFDLKAEITDGEKVFEINSKNIIYLPSIFIDTNLDIHLVYSENTDKDVNIVHKRINSKGEETVDNGIGNDFKNSINPVLAEHNKILYAVFQAKESNIQGGLFYNIVIAYSRDFGNTWEYKFAVTSKGENNQRPNIFMDGQELLLAWEKDDENYLSHIYFKKIDLTTWTDSGLKAVSDNVAEAHSPFILKINGSIYIFWYDNRKNNFQVYYSNLSNNQISDTKSLNLKSGRTISVNPVIFKKLPAVFWIQQEKKSTVFFQKTVTEVDPPDVFIRNVREIDGVRYINKKDFQIEWKQADNPAGIKGFRILVTKDRNASVPEDGKLLPNYNLIYDVSKIIDGTWFCKIKSYDNAGNSSRPSDYQFVVDTTPPPPPEFDVPELDDNGNLKNNIPEISWDEKSGNTYYFNTYKRYFANKNDPQITSIINGGKMERFTGTAEKSWKSSEELENGVLLFGVQGTDRAGNNSTVSWKTFSLANYVPKTVITKVEMNYNDNGEKILSIYGRGFQNYGEVTKVLIDRNRKEPYDHVISKDDFVVVNDNLIRGKKEFRIEDGVFYIGVDHNVRGVVFDTNKSVFSSKWSFKYQKENYYNFEGIRYIFNEINVTTVILIMVVLFWLIIMILLMITIINTGRERIYIKNLLLKIDRIKDELNEKDYVERRKVVMKKGLGLTIKYTFLILLLVISIVVSTSVTISLLSLGNERRNLANEMKDKALIMTGNYEASLVDIYTLEKGYTEAIDSTTLAAKATDINFVLFKLAEDNSVLIRYGANRKITFEGIDITKLPDKDKEKMVTERVFSEKADKDIELMKVNYDGNARIYPEFNPSDLKDSYIFIKPIFISKNGVKKYIGEIAVGFSFERILNTIYEESIVLFRIALAVTGIAVLLSIIGAITLATMTIRPIRKISKHVETITTKEDYEDLVTDGKDRIEVKSKDEIGILASSINDMTHKLIEKAKADKQLLLGKEIQKKFISLEPFENDYVNIYGYYEGAKGVSGDYFEYKKISEDHIACIICDVSGKAVPAALIMVQISTIFHSYFSTFKPGEDKLDTVEIVNQINDTIEERGFQGRFAAIMVMILNTKTGEAILTNAGYTQVLIYRDDLKKCEWVKLFQSGAAGVFPSYMLPDPFKLEKIRIKRKDIIFLFTDGIEESRNGKKKINEKGEESFEEFGNDRITKVIDESRIKNPQEIIKELIRTEKDYRGDIEQYDDLTILGIQRK